MSEHLDLVAEATRRFEGRDYFWAGYLARDLENRQHGLSVVWATRCVDAILHRWYAHDSEKWQDKLDEARRLAAPPVSVDEVMEAYFRLYHLPYRLPTLVSLMCMHKAVIAREGSRIANNRMSVAPMIGAVGNLLCPDARRGKAAWHPECEPMFAVCVDVHCQLLNDRHH